MAPGGIVLTDAAPLPKDDRCPDCGAAHDERQVSEDWGPPHDVCGKCGHEFDELTVTEAASDESAGDDEDGDEDDDS